MFLREGAEVSVRGRVAAVLEGGHPPLFRIEFPFGAYWLSEARLRGGDFCVGDRVVSGRAEWLVAGLDGDAAWLKSTSLPAKRATLPLSCLRRSPPAVHAGG